MAQSADLKAKIEGLNKVFQFYYKENFKTLRKATDFYIPWFIGRKKRLEEFQKQIENISHDLRTPLTSLLGYVRLYKKSQSF